MFLTLPNQLTLLRLLLSPVFFVMYISSDPITRQFSLLVFIVAALTDWYDGMIARRQGIETDFGKFLDPLADKFLTSSAFLAFALLGLMPWWMVMTIVARDALITGLRSLAERRGQHITTARTAQIKTFIQMAVLYYVLVLTVAVTTPWLPLPWIEGAMRLLDPTIITWTMFAVTVITVGTGIQYLLDNRHFLRTLISHAPPKS